MLMKTRNLISDILPYATMSVKTNSLTCFFGIIMKISRIAHF
jgi:hypothetical protein